MKIIKRNQYLSQLIDLIGTPDIKVITGIRRCGKSVLLQGFMDYLKDTSRGVNIVYINLQDLDYDDLKDHKVLHQYAIDHHDKGKENYLIIDEI